MQAIVSRVLQEKTIRIILTVSSLLLAMTLTYGLGRLGGLFVNASILKLPLPQAKLPPMPNEESSLSEIGFSKTYFQDILEQNIFDAAMSPQEEIALTEPEQELLVTDNTQQIDPIVESLQIKFKLYGTLILTSSAYAWLGLDSPNLALIFSINDCFSAALEFSKECTDEKFKLVKIEKKRVALLINGEKTWLELVKTEGLATLKSIAPQESLQPVAPPPPPQTNVPQIEPKKEVVAKVETPQPQTDSQQEVFQIQRVWVDEQLANFGQILQDARVIPEIKNETTLFKFDWIKEDSMYSRLGLKEGDIILSINDIIIDNISKAMGLLNKLQSEREIALEVEREGKRKILQYYIN